jgi:hypothetical protein
MAVSVSPNGKNHYETSAPADALLVATINGIVALELFAGTTDGDVFFSDSEGDTWSTIGQSLPPGPKGGHYRPLRPDLVSASH